jgi:NADPH2:quinone reductase
MILTLDFPARTETALTFVVANSLKTQLFPQCCHHPSPRLAFFQNQNWRTNKRSYQTRHFLYPFPALTSPRNPPVRATAAATTATATKMVKAIRVHELGGPEVYMSFLFSFLFEIMITILPS